MGPAVVRKSTVSRRARDDAKIDAADTNVHEWACGRKASRQAYAGRQLICPSRSSSTYSAL